MVATAHIERHFTSSDVVRDVVLGMADGLTVPFALAAGLTGAAQGTTVVVTAGLAEIVAGSIAMGLGGYLAGKSQAEHYVAEQQREHQEVIDKPREEMEEVAQIFREYGLSEDEIKPVVEAMRQRPRQWVDFMMRFELGLEKPDPSRARISATVIAAAYVVGGMIPLAPYMLMDNIRQALYISSVMTFIALAVFGFVKGRYTGARPLKSALQTTLTGGLAASAAFVIAKAIGG